MDMVEVITTAPHNNSYGDDYVKAEGDVYTVALDVAHSLKRDGLVDFDLPQGSDDQDDFMGTVIEE